MKKQAMGLLMVAGMVLPAYADGLLPAKDPQVIEVKMPDGTTQKGFVKDGAFIPLATQPVETTPLESKAAEVITAAPEILPAGTPVQIVIDKEIDSDEVKEGEMVPAHLGAPIKYQGKVIFPMGTPVKGVVTHRKNNFIAGVAGAIELGNFKIVTPDGGVIPLTGNFQRKGNSRVAGSLVGAYFIGLPIFIKGQDGKVESGAEATMYTAQEWDYKIPTQASK